MAKQVTANESDPEITAIAAVYDALKNLDAAAQARVLQYVAGKLGVTTPDSPRSFSETSGGDKYRQEDVPNIKSAPAESDDLDGISPVAIKWMRRSGLTTTELSKLFSVGGDEIDLVAENVPGNNKKDRMHSVLLLKGIAAYLSSGAARVSHDQVKEACLHYDAYDSTNFATYLKRFAPDVGGTKESGYTLTPRGLTRATEVIKSLLAPKS